MFSTPISATSAKKQHCPPERPHKHRTRVITSLRAFLALSLTPSLSHRRIRWWNLSLKARLRLGRPAQRNDNAQSRTCFGSAWGFGQRADHSPLCCVPRLLDARLQFLRGTRQVPCGPGGAARTLRVRRPTCAVSRSNYNSAFRNVWLPPDVLSSGS